MQKIDLCRAFSILEIVNLVNVQKIDLCRAFSILEIVNLVNVQKISQAGGEAMCSEPWTGNGARLRLGERPST